MIVGAIVEGHGEEHVVRTILGWLGVKHRSAVFRADGVNDLLQNARVLADLHLMKGATHVLFFMDADAETAAARLTALRQRLAETPSGRMEEGVFEFIPVQELEAWFLADEVALGEVLGARVSPVDDPQQHGAVGRLEMVFASAGKSYRKAQHAKEIADHASDARWLRCASYTASTARLR